MSIPDGRVWCEGCGRWLQTAAAYAAHRRVCGLAHQLVEERDLVPVPARRVEAPAVDERDLERDVDDLVETCRRMRLPRLAARLRMIAGRAASAAGKRA